MEADKLVKLSELEQEMNELQDDLREALSEYDRWGDKARSLTGQRDMLTRQIWALKKELGVKEA